MRPDDGAGHRDAPGAVAGVRALETASGQPFRRIVLVGNLGPPLLAFARSCRRLGVAAYLLEVANGRAKARPPSAALAGMDTLRRELIGTAAGVEAIRAYASALNADGLIAVSESILLWLAENRGHFEPDCRLLCPSHSCLVTVASKRNQIELAREAGFPVLPTWYLNDPTGAGVVPEESFPVCVRPSEPAKVSPPFKAVVAHTRRELRERMAALTVVKEPVIAQPFLMLPDLKVHGMRAASGGRTVFRPFLVERKFQGVTLTLRRSSFPPGTAAACERFAERANVTGAFHFDLLYSVEDRRAYFLEINARMGGVTDKAAAFGYDQPRLILEAFGHPQGGGPDKRGTSRRRVTTKRAVCKHIASALSGTLTELDYPPVGRIRHILLSLRDLMFARDSVFDWRDMRGTIWFNTQGRSP